MRRMFEFPSDAACRGYDPDIWFPTRGGDVRPARDICAICPVIEECLTFALENSVRFGIWGGLSVLERRTVRKARGLRKPGGVPVLTHGTPAAYRRHLREETIVCEPCRLGHNQRQNDYKAQKREAS